MRKNPSQVHPARRDGEGPGRRGGMREIRRPCRLAGLILLVVLSAASYCQAGEGDWPRFRGPDGAGHSAAKNLPVEVTPERCNWRVSLPGEGHSSPVVWGGKIFLTTADKAAGKQYALCLSTADGKELWRKAYDFTPGSKNARNSFSTATPAVDERAVYAVWTSPQALTVVALDHDGRELWTRDLGPFKAPHGSGSSPIVVEGVVIIQNDQEGNESFIIGLDGASGKTLWRHVRPNGLASYATPTVLRPKEGQAQVVFLSTACGLTSVEPKSGQVNWELRDLFKERCVGSPVVVAGLILALGGEGDGGKAAVVVRPPAPGSQDKPKVEYRLSKDLPYVPTPVAVGDLLFLWSETGVVTCVDGPRGQEVWSQRVGGRFYSSPIYVDGRLYAVSTDGELVVLEAARQYKLLGRSKLEQGAFATPAIAGGVMYIRTQTQLLSFSSPGGDRKPPASGATNQPKPASGTGP